MRDENFVNVHGLVRLLRLPREFLMAEARAGRIPSLRVGSRFRFNVDAVTAALAAQAATVTIENGTKEEAVHDA